MAYTTLLLDLDDTIYPPGNGLWEAIGGRIESFMLERMGLASAEIPALRRSFHARYGTTLRGLTATYQIDELEYLAYVHDIPVREYLSPNPFLQAVLRQCPLRKVIFTNADRAHALRVLNALDLQDLFPQIIDILDIRPYCKPMPQAYQIALDLCGCRAQECIFLDDAQRNLTPAQQLGITPVFVNPAAPDPPNGLWIRSLADLPQLYPALGIHTGLA